MASNFKWCKLLLDTLSHRSMTSRDVNKQMGLYIPKRNLCVGQKGQHIQCPFWFEYHQISGLNTRFPGQNYTDPYLSEILTTLDVLGCWPKKLALEGCQIATCNFVSASTETLSIGKWISETESVLKPFLNLRTEFFFYTGWLKTKGWKFTLPKQCCN